MSAKSRQERIIVALEPSPHGLAALEAAAEMASRLHAELIGVYVEDIDLLRMAGLPFSREFTLSATRGRDVDTATMERTFRGQASRLRQAFETATRRVNVASSFRVHRGSVSKELLSLGEDADMLIVGKAAAARTKRVRCGSTTRAVVGGYKKAVVVMQRGVAFGRPVVVVFDGSESAERALVVGARLAHQDHKNIVAAIVPAGARRTEQLEQAVTKILQPLGLRARCIEMNQPGLRALHGTMRVSGCRTLVLGGGS